MGDEFVVIVNSADYMCKKRTSLLTYMDKLENDLKLVKMQCCHIYKRNMEYCLLIELLTVLRFHMRIYTNIKEPDKLIFNQSAVKALTRIRCLSVFFVICTLNVHGCV
ncbi:uncharacterized protein LOC132934824 [Metopolophium dirhodum]|uniref:uncharacterized protein LOC132934824 n=1 Tax=Metopolophium dirhodum TaxID=44670 RepID=UPI002990386C|nr:uncharacterized protein LOC132934824 [Metopolophium dirhodum]